MSSLIFRLFIATTGACKGSSVKVYGLSGRGTCQGTGLPTASATPTELQTLLQIFFAILSALAVLFIVIGGLRYTISGGSPEDMNRAKSTIIYAIIGLVVAISAEAIVTFALSYIV